MKHLFFVGTNQIPFTLQFFKHFSKTPLIVVTDHPVAERFFIEEDNALRTSRSPSKTIHLDTHSVLHLWLISFLAKGFGVIGCGDLCI